MERDAQFVEGRRTNANMTTTALVLLFDAFKKIEKKKPLYVIKESLRFL